MQRSHATKQFVVINIISICTTDQTSQSLNEKILLNLKMSNEIIRGIVSNMSRHFYYLGSNNIFLDIRKYFLVGDTQLNINPNYVSTMRNI